MYPAKESHHKLAEKHEQYAERVTADRQTRQKEDDKRQ